MAKAASVILDVLYLITSLIFMIIAIVAYAKLSGSDFKYMYNIGTNWNSGPITTLNQDGTVCNINEDNYIKDKWPGTIAGCHCTFSLDFYGPLRKGACYRKRDNLLFCSTVAARPSIAYTKWKGESLCGKRVPASYLDLIVQTSPNSCPLNTRSCGIIDSLNNVMCVPTSTPCPLNFIKFIPQNEQVPTNLNYTVLDVTGGKIIVSNENTQGKLLNEFELSDNQPCADPGYKNEFKPNTYLLDPYYGKDQCQEMVGNIQFDDRYYLVDSYNSYSILNENNILPLISTLPEYPNPQQNQHPVNLYARNYIGIQPSCLQEIKDKGVTQIFLKDLYETPDKLGHSMSLAVAAMIIAIIIFVFMIIYGIFLCININSDGNDDNAPKFFIAIIPIVLALVTVILCSLTAASLYNYTREDSILTKKECVDDLTFQAASNFGSSVGSARGLSIFGSVLSVFLIILPIASLIVGC
jgi:hypothetical protein